jgi:hypothetical protein
VGVFMWFGWRGLCCYCTWFGIGVVGGRRTARGSKGLAPAERRGNGGRHTPASNRCIGPSIDGIEPQGGGGQEEAQAVKSSCPLSIFPLSHAADARSSTSSSLILLMHFPFVLLLAMVAPSLSFRLGGLHLVPISCPRCAVVASDAADPSMSGDPAAEAEAKELMSQYAELQAAQAAQGPGAMVAAEGSVAVGAAAARWRESEKEVSLWISVDGELRARDVKVVFGSRSLSLEVEGDTLLKGKALLGKIEPDESWWAFDDADEGLDLVVDEVPEGAKALQLVLAKADSAVWAGVFDSGDGDQPAPEPQPPRAPSYSY